MRSSRVVVLGCVVVDGHGHECHVLRLATRDLRAKTSSNLIMRRRVPGCSAGSSSESISLITVGRLTPSRSAAFRDVSS